jgi:drug/metabolite transporter (DMT)-like permease
VTKGTLQPYLWMLAGSFAFSWMGIFAHLAGAGCPWQLIAVVRSLVPLVLLAGWAWLDGARLIVVGTPVLWMRSIAGSCSLVACFYALTHMPPADVYTISNIFPIWVALLSWPMLGEVPAPSVWVSVFSGVLGVALVQQPGAGGFNSAAYVVVAASLFTALAMMGLHQLKHLDPRAVVAHFSGVSLVFSLVAWGTVETEATAVALGAEHVLLLLGVGVSASVGQFFLTKAFTAGDPARVSVVGLTQIVFVLVLDLLFVGNPVDPVKLLGIPLIIGPTGWLMLRRARRAARPRPVVRRPAVEPIPVAADVGEPRG